MNKLKRFTNMYRLTVPLRCVPKVRNKFKHIILRKEEIPKVYFEKRSIISKNFFFLNCNLYYFFLYYQNVKSLKYDDYNWSKK